MFDLPRYIKGLVDSRGETQGEFAARLGCKQTLVSAWIARRVVPGDDKLAELSKMGGHPRDWLWIQVAMNSLEGKGVEVPARLEDKTIWAARDGVRQVSAEVVPMTGTDPFVPAPPTPPAKIRRAAHPMRRVPPIFQDDPKKAERVKR